MLPSREFASSRSKFDMKGLICFWCVVKQHSQHIYSEGA